MSTIFVQRNVAPISQTERVWAALSAFVSKVGEIYNRNDAAKRSGLSWHYFSA